MTIFVVSETKRRVSIQLQKYKKEPLPLVIGSLKRNLVNINPCVFYINAIFGLRNTFLSNTRTLVEEQLNLHAFPTHLLLILKHLIKFRLGTSQPQPPKQYTKESNCKHFLKVKVHNKGIETINLSRIFFSRRVKDTIPGFFLLFFLRA